jgi:hypothetical protein
MENLNSTISRMPRYLRPLMLKLRSLKLISKMVSNLPYTPNKWPYRYDGVASSNSYAFLEEITFKTAYKSLVSAYGWDPGIPWRVHQVMWAAKQVRQLKGVYVECGVGRGGLMAALLTAIGDWNLRDKELYLFDTFEANMYDKNGQKKISDKPYKYYAKSFLDTQNTFAKFNNVNFRVGDVFETVKQGICGSIAFLSIDLNQAPAEEHVMRELYPNVVKGGVILLDDYYAAGRDRQRISMEKLAMELDFNILATPSGQGIVIKT